MELILYFYKNPYMKEKFLATSNSPIRATIEKIKNNNESYIEYIISFPSKEDESKVQSIRARYCKQEQIVEIINLLDTGDYSLGNVVESQIEDWVKEIIKSIE